MSVKNSKVYVVHMTRTSNAAIRTLLQIKAGASVPLNLIRAVLAQSSTDTADQQSVQINRKTVAATVTSYTPLKCGPTTDPAAAAVGGTSATGTFATSEGTDGDILVQDVWTYVPMSWMWLPSSESDYLFIDAGGIVALKLPVAPAGATDFTADLFFQELA